MQTRPWTYRLGLAIVVVAAFAVATGITAPRAAAAPTCDPPATWGKNRADLASRSSRWSTASGCIAAFTDSPSPGLLRRRRDGSHCTWQPRDLAHEDDAPPVSRPAYQRSGLRLWEGRGREHRLRLRIAAGRRRRLARLARPSGQHREPRFTSTGVGVAASGSGRLYWTPELRRRCRYTAENSALEEALARRRLGSRRCSSSIPTRGRSTRSSRPRHVQLRRSPRHLARWPPAEQHSWSRSFPN